MLIQVDKLLHKATNNKKLEAEKRIKCILIISHVPSRNLMKHGYMLRISEKICTNLYSFELRSSLSEKATYKMGDKFL